MYGLKNAVQAQVVCAALGCGFLNGLLYAALMAARAFIRHHPAAVAAEDVLFCCAAACVTFLFLLDYNYGIVRLYLLAAVLAGFLPVRAGMAALLRKKTRKISLKNRK